MTEADKERIATFDVKWEKASPEEKAILVSNAKLPTFKSQCQTRFRSKIENLCTLAKLFPILKRAQQENPNWKLLQGVDLTVGTSAYAVYRHVLSIIRFLDKSMSPRPGEYYQCLQYLVNVATSSQPQRTDAKIFTLQ